MYGAASPFAVDALVALRGWRFSCVFLMPASEHNHMFLLSITYECTNSCPIWYRFSILRRLCPTLTMMSDITSPLSLHNVYTHSLYKHETTPRRAPIKIGYTLESSVFEGSFYGIRKAIYTFCTVRRKQRQHTNHETGLLAPISKYFADTYTREEQKAVFDQPKKWAVKQNSGKKWLFHIQMAFKNKMFLLQRKNPKLYLLRIDHYTLLPTTCSSTRSIYILNRLKQCSHLKVIY